MQTIATNTIVVRNDNQGNKFVEKDNMRITLANKKTVDGGEYKVLRFQSYKGKGSALHMGVEVLVKDTKDALSIQQLIAELFLQSDT
jgi:hypothetical protein